VRLTELPPLDTVLALGIPSDVITLAKRMKKTKIASSFSTCLEHTSTALDTPDAAMRQSLSAGCTYGDLVVAAGYMTATVVRRVSLRPAWLDDDLILAGAERLWARPKVCA